MTFCETEGMIPEKGKGIWEQAKQIAPKLFSRTKGLDWIYIQGQDPMTLLNEWQLKTFTENDRFALQLLITKPLPENRLFAIMVFSNGKQIKLVALRGERDYSGCAKLVRWEGIVAKKGKQNA